MSAVKTIRRRFTVDGHTATLTVPLVAGKPAGVTVEWDRDRPPRLSGKALARYRRLRNAILAGVADEIGGNILMVDVEPDDSLTFTTVRPSMETAP